ncbi:MAG: spondin domain-containing protein [bacterium]|nr:spondin domain-containing protein [bacterium]
MKRQVWLTTLIGMLAIGCGDDAASTSDTDTDTDGTSTTDGPTTNDPSTSTTEVDPDSSGTEDPTDDPTDSSSSTTDDIPAEPVDFIITIENISDQGPITTPFSPGVWIEQDSTVAPVYTLNAPASESLEALAEDGDPSALATDIEGIGAGIIQSGVFDTPTGGAMAAPIMPGESYEIAFTAQPESRLGLASMMVGSNDVIWATGPAGISLYTGDGSPIDREITGDLNLFDAGTEANQPPAGGLYQPPGMLGADVGPEESGVISERNESTRHIVGARRLLDIDAEIVLTKDMMAVEGVMFTFTNISDDTGGFLTPLSPITWALHDDSVSLITPGGNADDLAGLEALAEDGDGSTLETTLGALAGIDQNGIAGEAPLAPGESVSFMVTPNPGSEILSFATMVVESNDAVIAVEPQGVPLLAENEDGDLVYRNPDTVANELRDLMEVWDIGTEANQTPGAGADTASLQDAANTGEDDADPAIRYYFDATNDLATFADNLDVGVSVVGDNVSIQFLNGSDGTPFEFTLSAGVAAMTPEGVSLFELGTASSAGLESLAEDGDATAFITELEGATTGDVVGAPAVGPGELGEFAALSSVTDAEPVLHFAAMIVPSNDTFIATGPEGVNIFDDAGALLTAEEIETAILASLNVYDAGTEQNQAAARGRDMAGPGLQSGPNTGEDEGSGNVRIVTPGANGSLSNEPVWEYPRLDQMIRVTVSPAR